MRAAASEGRDPGDQEERIELQPAVEISVYRRTYRIPLAKPSPSPETNQGAVLFADPRGLALSSKGAEKTVGGSP